MFGSVKNFLYICIRFLQRVIEQLGANPGSDVDQPAGEYQ